MDWHCQMCVTSIGIGKTGRQTICLAVRSLRQWEWVFSVESVRVELMRSQDSFRIRKAICCSALINMTLKFYRNLPACKRIFPEAIFADHLATLTIIFNNMRKGLYLWLLQLIYEAVILRRCMWLTYLKGGYKILLLGKGRTAGNVAVVIKCNSYPWKQELKLFFRAEHTHGFSKKVLRITLAYYAVKYYNAGWGICYCAFRYWERYLWRLKAPEIVFFTGNNRQRLSTHSLD